VQGQLDLELHSEFVLGPFVYAQRYSRQTQLVLDAFHLLLGRKASSSDTALQEIEVGSCICTPPTVSCIQVLSLLDRVKHSDVCVRSDWSWNVSRTSVRPAWPHLHYTEYPRPTVALTAAVATDVVDMGQVATAVGLVGAVCAGAVRSPLVVPRRHGYRCHHHCCSKGDMRRTRWQWTHPHQEHCQCRTHWHS